MKKYMNIVLFLGVLLALSSCKKDDESPDELAIRLGELSKSWVVSSATKDGADMAGYDSFQIILSGNSSTTTYTYTTTGRPDLSPWPVGGIWEFGENMNAQIIRDPGTNDESEIMYTLEEGVLTLEFDFSGDGYSSGRTESTSGYWVFKFSSN
jgi:hypothetical protein